MWNKLRIDKMSKQAIHSFFQHAREVKNRKPIRKPKVIVEEVIIPVENFDDVDETLMHGIFMYDHDLQNYLDSLDDKQYEHIMKNLNTYPKRIIDFLNPAFVPLVTEYVASKLTLKVVDLTDEKIEQQEYEEAVREEETFQHALSNFVPPPRPAGKAEEELNTKLSLLELENKRLGEALNQKVVSKTYVPPHLRNQTNPKVLEIKAIIQNLENEIYSIREKIDKEDELWNQRSKDEYRKEYKKAKVLALQTSVINMAEV